jgi:hypothetical protein
MSELTESLAGDQIQLEVGVEGPADQVEVALRAVRGVKTVERDRRDPSLWIVAGPPSIRDHLAVDLAGQSLNVRHLRRVGDELDEVYLRYFSRDEDGRDHAA